MKRTILISLGTVLIASVLMAQPANNAIFKGGIGDGFSTSNFGTSPHNIFIGGSGDGFNFGSLSVSGNSIFLGGIGDGWSFSNFSRVRDNIFAGGSGDGWHTDNFIGLSNPIFNGGNGDGWNTNNFTGSSNNIFRGGDGDGWAQVIYPLGPLPVTLLSFTGEQQGKNNLLKWATALQLNFSHFELERSSNLNSYIKIATVSGENNSSILSYSFLDSQPLSGNNFYRLKLVDIDGQFTYSNVVLLRVLNNMFVSVFPNPTADKLNISLSDFSNVSRVDLTVYDYAGRRISQQSFTNNIFSLDVSNYTAGIYILKLLYNGKYETFRFVKTK